MTDFTSKFHRTTYDAIKPSADSQAGRTILVTGASEGIGFNIANGFCEAGASTVTLVSRSREKLDSAAAQISERFQKPTLLSRVCDVASIEGIQRLWESLAQDKLTVDVLVSQQRSRSPEATKCFMVARRLDIRLGIRVTRRSGATFEGTLG